MAKGGITKGKSHKEGGIPMQVKSTGQKVELEGGEGVINKRNMSDTKKHTFDGKQLTKCEIASEINSDNNNGVEIECDDITGKQYKYKKGGRLEYPKDSLGIARKDMPQIRKDNYPDFFNELKEDNVLYYNMYINPNDYKPTQSYIDLERIKEIEASPAYNNNKPILVSNDYYVLDGHHRWYYKRKIKDAIPAVIIDLPIKDLIERARAFSAVEFDAYKKGGSVDWKLNKEIYEVEGKDLTINDMLKKDMFKAKYLAKGKKPRLVFMNMEYLEIPKYIYDEIDLPKMGIDGKINYAKGGKTKEAKTWKQKYNKKYGFELDKSHSLSEIAKKTGVSKKGIQQIYNKGIGAYKTNPQSVRPNVKSKEQWAYARVYSSVMGGDAAKVDAKELKMEKGGEIDKSKYISMFADTDRDGIPNVDDVSPFNANKSGQIEEVSMSEEMGEIIDFRNELDEMRVKFVEKLETLKDECGATSCGILSRTKTPYSIINKMRRRSLTGVKDLDKLENKAKDKIKNQDLSGLDLYKGLTDIVGTMVVAPDKESLDKLKDKILSGEMGQVLEFENFYDEPQAGYRAYHFIIGVKNNGKSYPIEVQLKTERAKNLSNISHTIYKRGKLDAKKYDEFFRMVVKADNGDEIAAMRIDTLLKNPTMIENRIRLEKGANIQSLKQKFENGGKITGQSIEALFPYYQLQALKEGEREIETGMREEPLFLDDVIFGYDNIPKLYEQDGKGKNQVVYLHYFNPSSDWYITELDKENLMGFGYAILNGDTQMSEFSYISLIELTEKFDGVSPMMQPNLDQYFTPKTLNQIFHKDYPSLAEAEFEVYENIKTSEPETSDYLNMNFKNPYERNLVIRELIDEKGDDTNNYTLDEKEFIRQYSGMGGLEKYGATSGLLYEYYTPKDVVEKMWGLAYMHRGEIEIKNVLEPSCATGNFIGYAPNDVNITGYDIDRFSLSVCRVLYPEERFTFYQAPFETLFIQNNKSVGDKVVGSYDLVIGNPPYGKFSGKYAGMGEAKATNAKDYIDYFISRGLDLLKPNGLLIFIIGKLTQLGGKPFIEQMKTPNKGQMKIKRKADLLDAYRLPVGMFETTDVESEIIVLRKK